MFSSVSTEYSWTYLLGIICSLTHAYFTWRGIPSPSTLPTQGLVLALNFIFNWALLHLPSASTEGLYVRLQTFFLECQIITTAPYREKFSCNPGWPQNVAEDDPEPWALRQTSRVLGLYTCTIAFDRPWCWGVSGGRCTWQASTLPSA